MRLFISFLFLFILNVFNVNAQEHQIKVMSWNVFLRPGILSDGQMNRAPKISEYLLNSCAEILVLQEVFHRKARRKLISVLSEKYPFHTEIGPRSFWGVPSGVLIFSKHPILKELTYSFSKARGSDRLAKKGVVNALFRINKRYIHVFGTHLQAGASEEAKSVQKSQLIELSNAVDLIKDSSVVILAGDFNITPDEELFALLSKSLDVKLLPFDSKQMRTANFKDQDLYPVYGDPVWIDYVFLKKTTFGQQISTWIAEPRNGNEEGKSKRLSDHNPIFSILEIH